MTITEKRTWSRYDVMSACLRNGLYMNGDIEDFGAMLDNAEREEPTTAHISRIAHDIASHSDGRTITDVMEILANQAVRTHYSLDRN